MITTRYGSEVRIVSVDNTGMWARVIRASDNSQREWRIQDLRADTIDELETALTEAPVYSLSAARKTEDRP